MNAFTFGQVVREKLAVGPGVPQAAPAAPASDPAAVLRAQRVAQLKAMRNQVQQASGVPSAKGNGTHQWSGRIMPNGTVQGAQYNGPTPAAPVMPPRNPGMSAAPR